MSKQNYLYSFFFTFSMFIELFEMMQNMKDIFSIQAKCQTKNPNNSSHVILGKIQYEKIWL